MNSGQVTSKWPQPRHDRARLWRQKADWWPATCELASTIITIRPPPRLQCVMFGQPIGASTMGTATGPRRRRCDRAKRRRLCACNVPIQRWRLVSARNHDGVPLELRQQAPEAEANGGFRGSRLDSLARAPSNAPPARDRARSAKFVVSFTWRSS